MVVIKSVVANYILNAVFSPIGNFLGVYPSDVGYIMLFSIASALLGILLGKACFSPRFNAMLLAAGIRRTTHQNIWDDVIPKRSWLWVYNNDGNIYEGQLKYRQDFSETPIIALSRFKIYDKDGNDIYISEGGETVVLRLEAIQRIITLPIKQEK